MIVNEALFVKRAKFIKFLFLTMELGTNSENFLALSILKLKILQKCITFEQKLGF